MIIESTRPPLIGLTTYGQKETGRYYLPGTYVDAVHMAGGVPVLLPPVQTHPGLMLERLDGLVLIGGGDIDPAIYDGPLHPKIHSVDPERDAFELALAQFALDTGMPLLGICRGLEIMIVGSGGDLVSHVPDVFGEAIAHRTDGPPPPKHNVQILPESQLAAIIGAKEVTVVSLHHQAAQTVPPGWRVTGWAPDGVIEALEHERHPWAIAVQWHPELSQDDPYHQRLFRSFIEAARAPKPALLQQVA